MGFKLRGKRAFPFIRQRDMTECGSTCLAMIFKYYGLYNIQSTLRSMAGVGKAGASLLTLSEIAENFGFKTSGYRLSFNQLSTIKLPCIAHYAGTHFVVVYKAGQDRVWVANPAYGKDTLGRAEFTAKWNGIVLTLEPTEKVFKNQDLEELVKEQKGSEKSILKRYYLSVLYPLKRMIFEILAISFILQILGLALPFFTQSVIDKVLVYQDKRLLLVILLGMLGIFFTQVVFTYVRNILIAQFKVNFELDFFSNFFNHFIHLKQSYFDAYKREDFINRFQENLRIRRMLSPALLQPFIDFIFIFNFVIVLFFYHTLLASIALGFILLLLLITVLNTPKLRRLEDKIFYDNMETLGRFMDTLLGIQTVKLLGIERLKLWEWKNLYTKSLNRVLITERTYARLQSTLRGIYLLSQISVYWIGAHMAFRGDLSIGQYIAFTGIFTAIMVSLNSIFTLWSMLTELSISYSRLNDVFMNEPEKVDWLRQRTDVGPLEKVELKGLSFRYNEHADDYALKEINLTLAAGEHVALVGRNGSGKTTLVKLLTKLYSNYEGKILINGVELRSIYPQHLRKIIAMIPQDVYLFTGTIKENILYGNPDASMEEVIKAARMADIHNFIQGLYLGYNHKINQESSTLSGGQRLKIAFARLFLSNPDLIILDEASSALDLETEAIIMNNLKNHFAGKTIISIAHRLHTVKNSDRIIVLDRGSIIEEGDHTSLVEHDGLYHQFIRTYLDS